jgi:hypothetical protein
MTKTLWVAMIVFLVIALAAMILLLTTGCSSAAPAANVTVCQHYMKQRTWINHLTFPTLADTAK